MTFYNCPKYDILLSLAKNWTNVYGWVQKILVPIAGQATKQVMKVWASLCQSFHCLHTQSMDVDEY